MAVDCHSRVQALRASICLPVFQFSRFFHLLAQVKPQNPTGGFRIIRLCCSPFTCLPFLPCLFQCWRSPRFCLPENRCLNPDCYCFAAKSCLTLLQPHGLQPARLLCPWDFPSQNTGVGCHFLLQGIFPTQRLNPGLLHCRQIFYCLIHLGSRIEYIIIIT